jgi:membrane-bound metal-dependent hydrolase YbcI (DUF457 family)
MFAIGHFAIGYLTAKPLAMKLRIPLNMPLLLTASVIPDVDLLLRFLEHRGPTHSLITIAALMIPFLFYYRKAAIPYAVALASHSMIGDLIGGTQLLWPFSRELYGALEMDVGSPFTATLELTLFLISTALMLKTRDLQRISTGKYRMVLLLPFGAVLGPMLAVGRGPEYAIPSLLIIPSLFYLAIFAYSLVVRPPNRRKPS